MVKCDKCGSKNERGAKYCRTCGASLKVKSKVRYAKYAYDIYANRKIIGILLALIIGGAVLYPTSIALEEHDFNGFDLDVPEGSDFELKQTDTHDEVLVEYANNGNHSDAAHSFTVGTNLTDDDLNSTDEPVDVNGTVKVYETSDNTFAAFKEGDNANIIIHGNDRNVVMRMAESFDDDDGFKRLNG